MLELKNVSKYYTNNGVVTLGLRNINLNFSCGEIVAITGDSGSGKSTLLNVITGVDTYEEGEIYFLGNETSYFNQNDMDVFRKNNVSFIFQNYNIIDSYSVLENVMVPLLLRGKPIEEAKREAKSIIEKVGLSNRIHHKGTKLSGGEKQRCVIARALASDAKILACDEPTGNLDSQTGDEIIRLIQEVAADKLVLIVTHNYNQVKDIVTRKIKMSDGEVIEDVKLLDILEAEAQEELMLVEPKIQKRAFLRLALKNIISTPKKTIFTSVVFLVISFIALILCLLMLEVSTETGIQENPRYSLLTKDRAIVYDLKHEPLNMEKIKQAPHKEIIENGFYEEIEFSLYYGNSSRRIENVKHTKKDFKYAMIRGREMKEEGDCILVLPADYNNFEIYEYTSILNESVEYYLIDKFSYHMQMDFMKTLGKVVGIATSEEICQPYLISDTEFNKEFYHYLLDRKTIMYYTVDGTKWSLNRAYDGTLKSSYILCSKAMEGKLEFSYLFDDLYPISYDIEVRYEDVPGETPYLFVGRDYFENHFDETYEAVVYSDDVDSLKKKVEEQGYYISIPTRQMIKPSTINLIYLYTFSILVLIALIGLFFISYVILARVYASKNKDYGVLRTLGMVKKQLGKVVILEVISLGMLCAIVSLVAFVIARLFTDQLTMGDYMGFGIIFFYFLLMLLFSYLIARRFNRRLYKFSVNTTLKGEVARND